MNDYMPSMDSDDEMDLPLAIASIPMQKWRKIYSPDVGFERATIFMELDLPFIGEEAVKNG